ncbi:hypothetical protein Ahy_B06g080737 isoform B [Arachis hypogaea]|uniref:Uncharacterized protein n=1 Tax=Arachis hypogaea TaxID=3818 RepID=A0A444YIW3_ARAHY|nr:hypothetical protein Ahy_B06g080737 isoform B [Arachis hypogaea]
MGLEFYMCRKLLNVHIPDLAHLAEKVRQTELMKKEKEKYRSEQRSKRDGLLDFLVQQKIKDRDVSLCLRCNAVLDAEAHDVTPPLSRSQAVGVQWIRNCQEFQRRDHLYRRNP